MLGTIVMLLVSVAGLTLLYLVVPNDGPPEMP